MGRPSDYSPEICAEICARLADGRSLRSICRDDDMPHTATVFVWLEKHPAFSEQYARARESQADALFDEALDIADTPQIGVKTVTKPGGVVEKTEGDMIEHRRLQLVAVIEVAEDECVFRQMMRGAAGGQADDAPVVIDLIAIG